MTEKEIVWGRVVGWRLRCRRLWAGFSQEQAAKRCCVARNTMGAWEAFAGSIPLHQAMRLAQLYGIDMNQLCDPKLVSAEEDPT